MKKALCILLAALLAAMFPAAALAQQVVNNVSVCETGSKVAYTVYLGEVAVDGETAFKYIYSADFPMWSDPVTAMETVLGGMADPDAAALFGAYKDEILARPQGETSPAGIAACSSAELAAQIDASWISAAAVGSLYYPDAEVVSQGSVDLNTADESFTAAVAAWDAVRTQEIDHPLASDGKILFHIDVNSVDDVYYTIEDGQVVKHVDTVVTYTCAFATVLYTRVELRTAAHTHTYDQPVWSWAGDFSSATATFECTGCTAAHQETDFSPVRTVVTPATATADEVVKYTAKVTFEGVVYEKSTPEITVPGTATGTPEDPPAPEVTLGDVDKDGDITSADARFALRRAVDLETYAKGSDEFIACDADKDGEVTSADARRILRAAVDLEDPTTW